MNTFFTSIKRDTWIALGIFTTIFIGLFSILYVTGFVPDQLKGQDNVVLPDEANSAPSTTGVTNTRAYIYPIRITISSVGIDAPISNPETRDVAKLDEYLTKGAVRYPDSGTLGGGNMFLFGHSTGFKVVRNQAYKTFNNLKDVKAGDIITVYSATSTRADGTIEPSRAFNYKAVSVTLVDDSKALVDFTRKEHMITISTCNTFGEKQERYVVEALFVG